jgi:superfamily II DNA or RNA helicase/DNA-binding transcriptional ArsR family regulator
MIQETSTPDTTTKRRHYWQAQSLAEMALAEFNDAVRDGDTVVQRREFYILANYYGRTLRILRTALNNGKEPLAQAVLQNLVTLHRPLAKMHSQAPGSVPLALSLDRQGRDGLVRDLIVRVLSESPEPLPVETVLERVNDLDILGTIRKGTVQRHLKNLVAAGFVERNVGGYTRSHRVYSELDLDALSLRAMLGPELYEKFSDVGFTNLYEVDARQSLFREQFAQITTLDKPLTADLFLNAAATLLDTLSKETSPWHHNDLLGSSYPRPYQYEAYAVFRGSGYQGQVVESPTGSGKTMIGMMCIQDWLRTLSPGQSILILVPTKNYQQQWIGELCYKPIGLRLSPEVVFSGTPAQLERFQERTGNHPAILIMTYTSLSQTGSAIGKGGFDADSIEIFLQGANIQYVVLDEVHKVVEDMKSVSAAVTGLLLEWLEDSSLHGLIGFSGTAESYRSRFERLGLHLAHNIPLDDLIAYGFVAPFAEFGVPFSNSARERQVRDLLDEYKEHLRNYFALLDPGRLRRMFAELPLDERIAIARDLLGMYRGRSNVDAALAKRLTDWENGRSDFLSLPEAKLVTILQIASGWSDAQLSNQLGVDSAAFDAITQKLEEIRQALTGLIYSPDTAAQLQKPDFAITLDTASLRALQTEPLAIATRIKQAKELLTTAIVGLYEELSGWFRRVGEGRVEAIKAVIEAERSARPVSGIIVFDNARQIHWREGLVAPGYQGVGGLFAQMLGDQRFVPVAVLSGEMYLAYEEEDPLPPRIAAFVEEELMRGEVAEAIFGLTTQGVSLSAQNRGKLQKQFAQLIDDYIPTLSNIHARRPGDFRKRVLNPLRRTVRRLKLGVNGQQLLMRLDLRNVHLVRLVQTFFDYALISKYFRNARFAELEQVSGARQKFFVVTMPSGSRKQLMYDLTARIVDDESLGINLIIVSNWARTGWNVIKPNVLIDATATRDVTAWQQLRGRAIRALRTWNNDCYRLMLQLTGNRSLGFSDEDELPEDVARAFEEVSRTGAHKERIDAPIQALLEEVAPREILERVDGRGLDKLDSQERRQLAIALMRQRNKVTHIYELLKAYGSTIQLTYDRPSRKWRRRDNIALKHENEISVQPFTGEKMTGAGHAPILYAKDPRTDLPAMLQEQVQEAITGADEVIVAGWMES